MALAWLYCSRQGLRIAALRNVFFCPRRRDFRAPSRFSQSCLGFCNLDKIVMAASPHLQAIRKGCHSAACIAGASYVVTLWANQARAFAVSLQDFYGKARCQRTAPTPAVGMEFSHSSKFCTRRHSSKTSVLGRFALGTSWTKRSQSSPTQGSSRF
jgi:hypothetical protein